MITEEAMGWTGATAESLDGIKQKFVEAVMVRIQVPKDGIVIDHSSPRLSRESQGNYRVLAREYLAHILNSLRREFKPLIRDVDDPLVYLTSLNLEIKSPPSFLRRYLGDLDVDLSHPFTFSLDQIPDAELSNIYRIITWTDDDQRYHQVYPYQELVDGLFPGSI